MTHRSESRPARDYTPVLACVRAQVDATREDCMRAVVDALWAAFGASASDGPARGVSWIGFYGKVADRDEMVLLECRDSPACSPIGLIGVCGRSWQTRQPILVDDVATLGEGYIACDPRDRSEVVVPLFDADGSCWGVLDGDSHETGAFTEHDVVGLIEVVEQIGLSAPGLLSREILRL